MKILLKLIFSIFLAASISILLMYAGVLTFKSNGTVAELKKKAEPVFHRIVDALNERLTVNENPVPDKENSKSVSTINKTVQKPDINDDSENRIYAEALAFLKRSTIDGKSDVEERFAAFLEKDLHVGPEKSETLTRMGFWINFVTLQQQWRAEDIEKMQQAFNHEKELKQAGFAAKELILMPSTVRDAEDLFMTMKSKMALAVREGDLT